MLPNKRSHCREKATPHSKEELPLVATRESQLVSAEAQHKDKQIKFMKKRKKERWKSRKGGREGGREKMIF